MEKIENNVCSIFIDESYRNFTKALNLINNTTDKNINEIYDRVLVISDENVYKTQLNKFIDLLNAKFVSEYIVPSGEDSKCIDTFEKILEHGLKAGLTRKSLIIAVGGGVVGDLSGYVAASYMRGIDFVQVPTTLLAQVDSSIGGKTGINLGTYKNVVGAFYQPQFTFINVSAPVSYTHLMADYQQVDKGNLTARQNGYVGGYMTKKLVEMAEQQMAGKGQQ